MSPTTAETQNITSVAFPPTCKDSCLLPYEPLLAMEVTFKVTKIKISNNTLFERARETILSEGAMLIRLVAPLPTQAQLRLTCGFWRENSGLMEIPQL